MGYGPREFAYAAPFVDRLTSDEKFLSWLLKRTRFSKFADGARLLHQEMEVRRSGRAQYWWRSHYSERCRCEGCSGQETDMLLIFESTESVRFALHIEVKNPGDKFKAGQAQAYPIRALCWTKPGKGPDTLVEHTMAGTLLLYSETRSESYKSELSHFDDLITFEEVASAFPDYVINYPV